MSTCYFCNNEIENNPVVDGNGRKFCSIDCAVDENFEQGKKTGQLGLFIPIDSTVEIDQNDLRQLINTTRH